MAASGVHAARRVERMILAVGLPTRTPNAMPRATIALFAPAFVAGSAAGAPAIDDAREDRWAAEIAPSIVVGDTPRPPLPPGFRHDRRRACGPRRCGLRDVVGADARARRRVRGAIALTLAKHPHPVSPWPRRDAGAPRLPVAPGKSRRARLLAMTRRGVGFPSMRALVNPPSDFKLRRLLRLVSDHLLSSVYAPVMLEVGGY